MSGVRLMVLGLKEEEVKKQDGVVDITVIKEPMDVTSLHLMLALPKEDSVLGLSKTIVSKKRKR